MSMRNRWASEQAVVHENPEHFQLRDARAKVTENSPGPDL